MRIKKPKIQALFVLLIGSMVLLFQDQTRVPSSADEDEESATNAIAPADMEAHVKTTVIHPGELPITLKATGIYVLKRQYRSSVVSRVAGLVKSVEVSDGQEIAEGSVIARLDDRMARASLAKAKAELRKVEAELNQAVQGGLDAEQAELDLAVKLDEVAAQQARQESNRQAALLEEHLTSEKSATEARQAREVKEKSAKVAADKANYFRQKGRTEKMNGLRASVEAAQAEQVLVELNLDAVTIRSPQTGRISGLNIHAGETIDEKTVLAQIGSRQSTVLRLGVSSQNIDSVSLEFSVTVQTSVNHPDLTGKVVSIGGELDRETGLVPVEVQLDSSNNPLPRNGEAVFAEIITEAQVQGFLVPVSALSVEDDKAGVFRIDEKHIAHAIPVEVLARNAKQALVRGEGLEDGSRIIVDGNFNLPDGAHVVEEPVQ